jgi:MFS family permease
MPYTPAHNLPDPDFDPESSRPGRELAIEAEAGGLVIAVSQLMVLLDTTIVTMALPRIGSAFGFSATGLLWVVNLYGLIFGGLLLLGGRAGDILGRRRVLTAGLVLFSAASLLGGLAPDKGWLLAARAVQGAGAARRRLPKSHRIDRTAIPFETVVEIILTGVRTIGRVFTSIRTS